MHKQLALALTIALLYSGQSIADTKSGSDSSKAKTNGADKTSKSSPSKAKKSPDKAKAKLVIPEQKMPRGFKEALTYQAMNVYDKAIPLYMKALQEDPQFISTYNNLAQCLFKRGQKGDKEKATQILAQSLKMDPNNVGCLYTKAIISESNKKYDEAEDAYRKILEVQPLNFRAVQNLSEMLFTIGKRKEARQVLVTVIAKDPPEEHKKIYEQALKNLDKAIKEKSKSKTG